MKITTLLFFLFTGIFSFAQSFHQQELLAHPDNGTELVASPKLPVEKSNCNLNKMVFGWHPYWANGLEDNYDWNLISDFCFFGYEVDYTTGNATSTHAWSTNDAVDTALAKGKDVHLCVMLFANHASFFGNASAKTTLINNLVSMIQTRGANGVNIDFEGVPASQSANLTSFMIDLGTALHAADPNYKLSICLYAVDWNNVFNETALNAQVDFYTIMGYDYYYTGSTQAGPTDPLYGFSDSYDYSLSRSVSYYLNAGIPQSKLVLGLPYYGREWETTSNTIPGSTTGNNVYSRTYDFVKTNASGNYVNPVTNTRASSKAYIFQNTGTWRQCWISEENELRDRYDLVNRRGLKGIGIWALSYDDGFSGAWDAIADKLTNCNSWACSDTIYDEGGPEGDYYNNERVEYTVNPPGAVAIDVSFLSFATEANYDTLWIYDGSDSNAPLIGAYHGSTVPAPFTTTSGSFTLRFKSDGGTRANGWALKYSCIQDNQGPTVASSLSNPWVTESQNALITASDESGVAKMYWNPQSIVPGGWQASTAYGQAHEEFYGANNWVNYAGNWSISPGTAVQSDETSTNSSYGLAITPNGGTDYMYRWKGSISGAGTNRRAGMHFMCSDLTLPNRGNSYFVWFRVDNDVIQVYEVTNDVFSLTASFPFTIDPGMVYDCVSTYSTVTGEIKVFVDGNYVGSWTDTTPLTVSQGVSLRSANAAFTVTEVTVLTETTGSEFVEVGPTGQFFSCNPDIMQKAGKILASAIDVYNNLSFDEAIYDVDFTNPEIDLPTEGAVDFDTLLNSTTIDFWNLNALDTNSGIASLQAEIRKDDGTVIAPMFNVTATNMSESMTGLVNQQHYSITVYACNGAGLCDSLSSDGFVYINDVGIGENSLETIVIYPNPTTDKIAVEMNQGQSYRLIDANGNLVSEGEFVKGINWVDLSKLAQSNYELVIGKRSYSIIKQ